MPDEIVNFVSGTNKIKATHCQGEYDDTTSPKTQRVFGQTLVNKDFRARKLESFGLGSELICTIQIKRIKRIKAPDIMGSTIEMRSSYRIAWNKAWLESSAK